MNFYYETNKIDEFLELAHHNKELEKELKEEVAKIEKDKLMFQQAKLASLGKYLKHFSSMKTTTYGK